MFSWIPAHIQIEFSYCITFAEERSHTQLGLWQYICGNGGRWCIIPWCSSNCYMTMVLNTGVWFVVSYEFICMSLLLTLYNAVSMHWHQYEHSCALLYDWWVWQACLLLLPLLNLPNTAHKSLHYCRKEPPTLVNERWYSDVLAHYE